MQEKFRRSSETMPSSASAYVEDAADFAKALTLGDVGRAGDYGPAMARVAKKVGVGHSLLKRLHYDAPKDIGAANFERLARAYGEQRKAGRATAEVKPRTALGRWLVEAADKMDRFADAMDRPEDVN